MLLRRQILEGIKAGEITLAFRRWRRPTVKGGGTLKTAVGVLAIERVEPVVEGGVTDREARNAGYTDRVSLLRELGSREGDIYRIALRYAGEDPRIVLRENDDLDALEMAEIRERLRRLDASSRVGVWTVMVLAAIQENPQLAARDLASRTGFEKDWLKTSIRKLKNLGLTVSHHPGYALSRRGEAVLRNLTDGHA